METFWLVSRKDMLEANDSMVCKFVPRKAKKKEKKITPVEEIKEKETPVKNGINIQLPSEIIKCPDSTA